MSVFRQSRHPIVRWWWEMDRVSVLLVLIIMGIGAVAVTTASVAVAKTYSVGPYYFALRHYMFLIASLAVMMVMTGLKPMGVLRLGIVLFGLAFLGTLLTFVMGVEVKGARRWIEIAGQSVQPTEFMKPALIIVSAWLLSGGGRGDGSRGRLWGMGMGFLVSLLVMGAVGLMVLMQPNFGMVLALGSVWGAQVLMAGVPLLWVTAVGLFGVGTIVGGYFLHGHVRDRIQRFLNPEGSDTYQIDQSLEAIMSGHIWGRGAGEGVVKHTLPDAHTDFIYAVVVEEFGIIVGMGVLMVFLFLVWRGFIRALQLEDRFSVLAVGGFLTLISLQVCVNIGVALGVLPTTGMTLPFVSYGGSSSLAMALVFGFLLALLRKHKTRV